jgi:hypothetical protein
MTNTETSTSKTTPVLTTLLTAHHATEAARETARAIPWAELPGLLRALGSEQSAETAAMLAAGPMRDPADASAMRSVLASIGDRAMAPGRAGRPITACHRAVGALCAELCGVLAASTTLWDVCPRY